MQKERKKQDKDLGKPQWWIMMFLSPLLSEVAPSCHFVEKSVQQCNQSSAESAMPHFAPRLLVFHTVANLQSMNFVLGCGNNSWGLDVQKPKDTRTTAWENYSETLIQGGEVQCWCHFVRIFAWEFFQTKVALRNNSFVLSLTLSDYLTCIKVVLTCRGRVSCRQRFYVKSLTWAPFWSYWVDLHGIH